MSFRVAFVFEYCDIVKVPFGFSTLGEGSFTEGICNAVTGGLASESSFCSSLILVDSFSSPYLDRHFCLVGIYLLIYLVFIRPGWPELALFSVFYLHWLPRLRLSVPTGSRHSFCSWLSSPCRFVVECPNLLMTMHSGNYITL